MKKSNLLICILLVSSVLLTSCVLPPEEQPLEPTVFTTAPTVVTEPTLTTEPTMVTEPPTEPETEPPTEPVTEPVEPPTEETKEPADGDMVRVKDYIPDISVELKYATTDNFTGQVIYTFTEAYLRYGTVKKLMQVQETLKTYGFGLKIWDAFRPLYGQQALWDAYPDANFVSRPGTGVRAHCRGHAVDITMVDSAGNEVEMPSGFDNFTALGDKDYSDCSEEAAYHASLLDRVMKDNGFTGYKREWWHYVDTVDYPLEEMLDPAVASQWYVNCNQWISLRKTASSSSVALTRINKGERLTVLGWTEKFAYVDYAGQRGYVLATYLLPVESLTEQLSVVQKTAKYSYSQMCTDLSSLVAKYPEYTALSDIGTSENGLQIPVLLVGNPDSENQILLQGGIHGREHATSWLLMAMAELWLSTGSVAQWDVCFHIIPMTNPDGVAISQSGTLPAELVSVYNYDLKQGYTSLKKSEYAIQWKANANGVDLNRNFDMGWEDYQGRTEPSSERYKGESAVCAAEAKALQDYTLQYDFDATLSYHASGSVLYIGDRSQTLAREMGYVTGYTAISASKTDAAGYRDWAEGVLNIPSVTVEVAYTASPLPEKELESVLARNEDVLKALAHWVLIK